MAGFSLAKIIGLLEKANDQQVNISFVENELSVHVEKGKQIDKSLLDELRMNKPFLIHYFKNFANKEHRADTPPIQKIDRNNAKKIPLSFAQERLWFLHQLEGSVQYHLPTVLRLKGKLNSEVLQHTLQTIVNRHEVLRTVILDEDGRGFQQIKAEDEWRLKIVDGSVYNEDSEALQIYIRQLIMEPFNLLTDDMLRAVLINLGKEEHILVVTMHHIASDAQSKFVLVKEVVELYSAFLEERTPDLPPLEIQYADYASWQRNYLQEDVLNNKLEYWKNKLDGLQTLQLPTDHIRPVIQSAKGNNASFNFDKPTSELLHRLSQQQGVTMFITFLAVYKIMLYRYSGQPDICVGTSFARREQQEVEGLIGFFVNTLALRDELNPADSFIELLQKVKTTTLGAYENQDIPFEKVVETVVKERDPGRNPLFQVMLVWAKTPEFSALKLGNLELSPEAYEANTTKFDLTFFITETPNGLQGSVRYSSDLFVAATVQRMILHFQQLLMSVVKNPQQKIGCLPMLTLAEEHQLLKQFNNSQVAYPQDKSTVTLFEEQVAKTPYKTAVVFEEETLTYRQLNERSNQLAHYLVNQGVKQDSMVPLYIERSAGMIIGILGIMKAGAAYVPIDTDLPAERISFMLQDTGSAIVVSSKECAAKLPVAEKINSIAVDAAALNDLPTANLATKVAASQLAYVIYTSGSTGKPKGVMIEHRSLVDYTFGLAKQINISECSSFALVSTIATDLGNTVLYASLLSGGALHVFSKESVSNVEYLHEYFSEHNIDCLKIVPSHWKALCTPEALLLPQKLIIFGGEALQSNLVELIRLSGSHCRVVNHYGPTETTIGKLLHEVKPGNIYHKTIPIGKPFSNAQVYVLSKERQLCPVGVPGQLFITGDGLARGYFKNDELTEEKFINDPFAKQPGSKMYGTGDLVKWLEDGNIEFIGRVDDQVKIRGYRVELGEIETALQQSELVSHAVVLAKEDKQGNKRLVAYLVTPEELDRAAIIAYLKHRLPDYMIPSVLVELETLPLTANGKVNRKALPDPDAVELSGDRYVAPRNETEAKLAGIWQDILELDQVGVHDDFFELGGHSLLAVRLISAIRKAFVVEMPIGEIFDHPTVAQLAVQVAKQAGNTVLSAIEVVTPRPDRIPLSFSQERLWFIDRLEGSVQYHVPVVLQLKGKLDINALTFAFQGIINRHEVLRSVILEDAGRAYQCIKNKDNWQLAVVDGSLHNEDQKSLEKYIKQLIAEPFDLSKDDMIRATLITQDPEKHILVATLHHIASDGWSKSILVKEVVELYNSAVEGRKPELAPLKVQYADFAIWQQVNLAGELYNKKLGYWKKKLEDVAPLQLPADFKRPAVWSIRGASEASKIDKELSRQLLELGQKNGTTLFMTLLAAFKILLYRYSRQNDICVGTPIAGRQQQVLEGLIGFFVNTLALRTDVQGQVSFINLLQQVRSVTMEAYENQEVPFEKVVDEVVKERDISRNPLFQVMFVMRNMPEIPELHLGELSFSGESAEHTTAKFDIQVFITETPDGLGIATEYCTDLFTSVTIKRMMVHFKELLLSIVKDPKQKISALSMLTRNEERQLTIELNNTLVEYPANKNVIDLFEEQVLKTPDAVAVVFEEKQFTYNQLNQHANQLAYHLKGIGIKEETLVPVCLERGLQMIVAIWGILKAGAAYVPVDPDYPEERIRYMLEDTAATVIVTSKTSRNKIPAAENIEVIELDDTFSLINDKSSANLNLPVANNHLAYVIYTSGSTGKPKGAMNEHGGLVNRLLWAQDYFHLTHQDTVLQKTTFCFDVSVWELLWPLIVGAKLVFAKSGGQKDSNYLRNIIEKNKISVLHFVPSMLAVFLPDLQVGDCASLKKVLCSGEALKFSQVLLFKEKLPDVELHNLYGPTEAAIDVTCWSLQDDQQNIDVIPIGKPISNTTIYILDDNESLSPLGGVGEIHIGGVQVCRGYLNRPELTAQKFIKDIINKKADTKLYKTGDLGRWMPDGNIEYLGRKDDQVKIRGYRIELGEIETVLQQYEWVNEAVVLAKTDKEGNTKLVSYYVPSGEFVKLKEQELYLDRVNNWKDLYNTEYAKTEDEDIDEEFNLIGWNSSFTGEVIPPSEMRLWVDDIVNVVLSQKAENVLEIGCGTGLIYYPLAGKVNKYTGTDLSATSIGQIAARISKGLRDYGPTELKVCPAHQVTLEADETVDTIILNSIVQYFPGQDYMNQVIEKCVSLLDGSGRIIIGDVRDYRLLELFKGRLQLQNLAYNVDRGEFNWAVEQEVLKEEELCFNPEYFYRLQSAYPQISHIEIKWKEGVNINELTLYRYTAVIHVGPSIELLNPDWQNWNQLADKKVIIKQLEESNGIIAVKNVPNFRLWQERLLTKALNEKSANTIGDLLNLTAEEDEESLQIKNILGIAKANGYHIRFLLNADPLKMDLVIESQFSGKNISRPLSDDAIYNTGIYTNIPLFTDISLLIQKDLKELLKKSLPEYMVPSLLIALRQLPLTNNGKIDRKFLSLREEKALVNNLNYKAPSTATELLLAKIWQELLGADRIGIYDNFFELGGHSLLAMRVISSIRKELELQLAIKDLFQFTTIYELAKFLEIQLNIYSEEKNSPEFDLLYI